MLDGPLRGYINADGTGIGKKVNSLIADVEWSIATQNQIDSWQSESFHMKRFCQLAEPSIHYERRRADPYVGQYYDLVHVNRATAPGWRAYHTDERGSSTAAAQEQGQFLQNNASWQKFVLRVAVRRLRRRRSKVSFYKIMPVGRILFSGLTECSRIHPQSGARATGQPDRRAWFADCDSEGARSVSSY